MNATNLALSITVGTMFGTGGYLLMQRTMMRVILGFILIGHAANLILLMSGGRAGDPPVAGRVPPVSDPMPQAMALTAIVITFGVTALLLALAHRSIELNGDDEVQDDVADRLVGRPVRREDRR